MAADESGTADVLGDGDADPPPAYFSIDSPMPIAAAVPLPPIPVPDVPATDVALNADEVERERQALVDAMNERISGVREIIQAQGVSDAAAEAPLRCRLREPFRPRRR